MSLQSLSLTWTDYFYMDSSAYQIKKGIVQLRDTLFDLQTKKSESAWTFASNMQDKAKSIQEMLKEHKVFDQRKELCEIFNQLNDRITMILTRAIALDQPSDEYAPRETYRQSNGKWNLANLLLGSGKVEGGSFNDITIDHSTDPVAFLASNDDLSWPGGIHIPFDVEVNIPSSLPSTNPSLPGSDMS